jgi:thioester reductase-like protein
MTLVLGHPDVPMSAHYVSHLLEHGSITALLTPPSILEDLSNDPQSLRNLAKLSQIGYGGGPLQPDVGNLLSSTVPHLFSYIGATEYGWFHNISGDNSTWDSLCYSADIGYRFDEVSEGVFELVIDNDPRTNKYHGIFEVFPELKEYRMRDLYTPSPNAPGWMRYRGRSDDLIVLSNGEKINPIPMENIIRSHPGVKAALVVGEYRFNPSLLIELEAGKIPQTEAERRESLDQLWASVQEANKIAAGFAKVPKSLVLFASAEKPFQRAGKGTVQRQLTVKAYAEELEYLYSSQESDLLTEGLTLRKPAGPDDIRVFVKEIYTQALEQDDLKDSDDVFQHGMDSLGVAVIVARLKAALRDCEVSLDIAGISQRLIYSAPSVEKITESILNLAKGPHEISDGNEVVSTARREKLGNMLEKYWAGIMSETVTTKGSEIERRAFPESLNVVLTGTTGSLGSHLLATLDAMPDSKIRKIFCLNRSADGKARQEKSNAARGLKSAWNEERVQFIQADLTQPDLGLGPDKCTKLLRDATVIIHSAWKVDFNLSVDSFEPQIKGVRNLLDFSAKSANKAPLIFISSISAAFGWLEKHPKAMVPEAVMDDYDAPEQMGYGESKFISEHLIKKYAAVSGVNAAIFRTGQIAGSLSGKGIWNKQEWFPSLMTSSKHLGAIPETLGSMEVVDWIPADLLASIMLELTEEVVHKSSQEEGTTSVYNLVNPKASTWSALCSPVQQLSGIPRAVRLKEWVRLLEDSSKERNGAIIETNPAVKLLDFFRILSQKEIPSLSPYAVDSLIGHSRTAANLEAVKPEWIQLWMSGWK